MSGIEALLAVGIACLGAVTALAVRALHARVDLVDRARRADRDHAEGTRDGTTRLFRRHGERLDELGMRLAGVEGRVDSHSDRLAKCEARMSSQAVIVPAGDADAATIPEIKHGTVEEVHIGVEPDNPDPDEPRCLEQQCRRCRFYLAPGNGGDDGLCRRFPPTPLRDSFPVVCGSDWCGEYQPREGRL